MRELLAYPTSYLTRDTEVAEMIARYAGPILGLFAFAVTVFSGLIVENPVTITLQRGVWALLVFCLLGLILGWAAQTVVREYEQSRAADIDRRYPPDARDTDVATEESSGSMPEGELSGA